MCGRFTQQRPTSEIAAIFEAEDTPTTRAAGSTSRRRTRRRWSCSARSSARSQLSLGLIPGWSDDARITTACSTLALRPIAGNAGVPGRVLRRRCLVQVDGYYEWLRDGSKRQPMRDPRAR